jgi:WD40 repeat protein/transcriptional regulator with XRE-family HTH domain
MKRSSYYKERDFALGQMMLALRTHIGLTQAGLAELLGVSRRAVSEWEAGNTYPKAEHLKQLIALGVQQQAFPAGREAEEIRALWKAAHQKLLLDEAWLAALLTHPRSALTPLPTIPNEEPRSGEAPTDQPTKRRRMDWGDALAVPTFYGRKRELAELSHWVVEQRCRVVSVLGMGGIGKSALVVSLLHQLVPNFEVVIWRSLRDAPICEALLEDLLQVLAPQPLTDVPVGLERRLGVLLEYLREERALIVLDNLEVLLEEGESTGRMRAGYEGYGRLLRRVAETEHQSCLLLTSREKPSDLVALEGSRTSVCSLRLEGLEREASEQLLEERELMGTIHNREQLIQRFVSNPLALKIVAETIVELFGGEIAPFLEQGEVIIGSIRELLGEQFSRLSSAEQTVLLWLAILREPVSIEDLLEVLGTPLPRVQMLEAVEALRRRSLLERGQRRGSFTLQSVVLEYATAQLIEEVADEIEQGRLVRLIEHGLELATAREYVRQTQQRLIVLPILALLRGAYTQRDALEEQLLSLLAHLRTQADYAQGYGPANVLALLLLHRGHLRGLYLSRLALRGAYLQGVEMQDANLSGATVRNTVFTDTFDVTWAVAISGDGQYWAAASKRGEVRVWEQRGQTLLRVWQAHTDTTFALAFSPDGRSLVSGSWDGTIKQWDLESGALLWSGWHTNGALSVAFAPDGDLLASGGNDATVQLWDLQSGTPLQTLVHPSPILSVAWSPDGRLLASGSFDGCIRLWEIQNWTCIAILVGHTNRVRGLAFTPNGSTLVSASWDGTVKLWDVGKEGSQHLQQTLTGHTDRVNKVALSPDGRSLASCGFDKTVRLWDVEQGIYRAVLHGHAAGVNGLAFTPDSHSLLSGSEDGTLRLWEVTSGQCVRVMQGYAASLFDIDWSPDGKQLVSGGTDTLVTLWEAEAGTPLRVLRGHGGVVFGVGWSPDGRFLASSAWDNVIRLWDPATGVCVQVLQDPDYPDTLYYGMAWRSDGQRLASGTNMHGVQVSEVNARSQHWVGRQLPTWIRHVAWSPDGTQLVGGGDDGNVYIWDASDGTMLQRLSGHQGVVTGVAWSPDGARLASSGRGRGSGELFVWDAQNEELVRAFAGHPRVVYAVAWGSSGDMVVSGGSDGMLRWWNVHSGECDMVHQAHRGTIRSLRRSPDGSRLASCGDDGAITLWDLRSGVYLRTLRRDRPYERLNITRIGGLTQAQKVTLQVLGAIEDPPMNSNQQAL